MESKPIIRMTGTAAQVFTAIRHLADKAGNTSIGEIDRVFKTACPIKLDPIHCPNCYFNPTGKQCEHDRIIK